MSDTEMDFINGMFRAELEKFKQADKSTRMRVVEVIANAGGIDWLFEVSEGDDDPAIRAYADLAEQYQAERR